MMAIFWLSLAAYLAGWVIAVRPALKRRMLVEVCTSCRRTEAWGHPESCVHHFYTKRATFKPRGALRDRDEADVWASIWVAAWWPAHLIFFAALRLIWLVNDGITGAVVRTTPLTKPELERRIREQQAEIDRLSKQIGGGS